MKNLFATILLSLLSSITTFADTVEMCPVYAADYETLSQRNEAGDSLSLSDRQKLKIFHALEAKGYSFVSTEEAKQHPVDVDISDEVSTYQETTTRGCFTRSKRMKTIHVQIFSGTRSITHGYATTMVDLLPANLVPFSKLRKRVLRDVVDCAGFMMR